MLIQVFFTAAIYRKRPLFGGGGLLCLPCPHHHDPPSNWMARRTRPMWTVTCCRRCKMQNVVFFYSFKLSFIVLLFIQVIIHWFLMLIFHCGRLYCMLLVQKWTRRKLHPLLHIAARANDGAWKWCRHTKPLKVSTVCILKWHFPATPLCLFHHLTLRGVTYNRRRGWLARIPCPVTCSLFSVLAWLSEAQRSVCTALSQWCGSFHMLGKCSGFASI